MLRTQAEDEGVLEQCEHLLRELSRVGEGEGTVELLLLDPMGHSQIMHDDASPRELTDEELSELQTGPSVPVFDADGT